MLQRRVDLQTIAALQENGKDKQLESYQANSGIEIKPVEAETILSLVKYFKSNSKWHHDLILDGIFFDFKIEGIEKEFDIIKITQNCIINLELKSGNVEEFEMEEQLVKNKFYFDSLGFPYYLFTYNAEHNTVYTLNQNNQLVTIDSIDTFISLFCIEDDYSVHPKQLFNPSKYLVSPFNDVDRFLNREYLLTDSQKKKKESLKEIIGEKAFLIGNAGTGKTLLLYDLAIDLLEEEKIVNVLHCGKINSGHEKLNKKVSDNFKIYQLKEYSEFKNQIIENSERYFLIDEVQRLNASQLEEILDMKFRNIIFSGDPKQGLGKYDAGFSVEQIMKDHGIKRVKLNNKVRTNRSMAEFIKGLMDSHYIVDANYPINKENISVSYFLSHDSANDYLNQLRKNKRYNVLALPGSLHNIDEYTSYNGFHSNSYDVIGQEFDNVATVIGENLNYAENGKLRSSGTYYTSSKALFQNLTRVRKELKLVIVNNNEIFDRAMELLN